MEASAQRLRVGAELRRLREQAGVSGEHVARQFGWSQSKVSRMEIGRHAITVKDVAGLLAYYGVSDDVRAELLAATAGDTGELSWIVQAGGYPRRQQTLSALESVTRCIRHYQPVVLPGLLQTRDYARLIASAAGAQDPDGIADARMKRQGILTTKSAPRYEVVVDARALLLRPGPVEIVRSQLLALPERAGVPSVHLQIIPIGAAVDTFATVGFNIYDFKSTDSPSVAWIESPTGDVYYAAAEDIDKYAGIFGRLQDLALSSSDSVEYLVSLATDLERYMGTQPGKGRRT